MKSGLIIIIFNINFYFFSSILKKYYNKNDKGKSQ